MGARRIACVVCRRRKPSPGHPTCQPCRQRIAEYSANRYAELRAAGLCYRCEEPAAHSLCESCAEQRRERRRRLGQQHSGVHLRRRAL